MFDIEKAISILNDKLEIWFAELVKILPNLLLAAFILVIGFFVAKFIRRVSEKVFNRIFKNFTINNLFSTFVYIVFLGIVFLRH